MNEPVGNTGRSASLPTHAVNGTTRSDTPSPGSGQDKFVDRAKTRLDAATGPGKKLGGLFAGFHGLRFLARVSDWVQTAMQGKLEQGLNTTYGPQPDNTPGYTPPLHKQIGQWFSGLFGRV